MGGITMALNIRDQCKYANSWLIALPVLSKSIWQVLNKFRGWNVNAKD